MSEWTDALSVVAPSSEAGLLACTASEWQGETHLCRWCNGELPKRRRRWCSDGCAWAFTRNHQWSNASRAAKKRDGHMCVECRMDPRDARDKALMNGAPSNVAHRFITLQVHHKTPVLGKHGVFGCHHHLEGLETLCLNHHLERHRSLDALRRGGGGVGTDVRSPDAATSALSADGQQTSLVLAL